MTVRINANSCKNVLGTVFLLATVFFVCSTFISMRSVLADPIAPANTGVAQTGRQSPRSTSRNVSNRTISRSTTSRGTVARTAVASTGTTASRAAVAPTRTAVSRGTGATRTVASRSIAPTRSNVTVSGRSVATRGTGTSNQSSNRAVRARGATASRVSVTGNVTSSGSRASANTTYAYLASRLNTGYSNIIDSTTGMISAEAYANCMDSYYACMDEICTARSSAKGRCSCAGRAKNFLAAEQALERANEELITLSGQLSLLIATKGKGDDLAAAFSLTDAEKVMNCVSWRDTYAKCKSGDCVTDDGKMNLMEQWYMLHPTYQDASSSELVDNYDKAPYYCDKTNNNFGFDISQIDGSSSDILAQLKAWADAKDLANTFTDDDTNNLVAQYTTIAGITNRIRGVTLTVDQDTVDKDTLAKKWGYGLYEYAHNNVCGRVLDSCFNGIYEACGTPITVKDSDGKDHSKCQNGATTSCPFNYNSYINVNKDTGDVELHERNSSNTSASSSAACFGYSTTTSNTGIRTTTTSSNDPYYALRGPVADARRSIMQKYLLDANAACDTYGDNLAQTAQNINYQKVAAQQALQQKRLDFKKQERSSVLADAQEAINNFSQCLSEIWDCYDEYQNENGANWTTARIKSYCSQVAQVPHCYEPMICSPLQTSLTAVVDKPDSDSCTFTTNYATNNCRNVVTISEILQGTGATKTYDLVAKWSDASPNETTRELELPNVNSAEAREACLQKALNCGSGALYTAEGYCLRTWTKDNTTGNNTTGPLNSTYDESCTGPAINGFIRGCVAQNYRCQNGYVKWGNECKEQCEEQKIRNQNGFCQTCDVGLIAYASNPRMEPQECVPENYAGGGVEGCGYALFDMQPSNAIYWTTERFNNIKNSDSRFKVVSADYTDIENYVADSTIGHKHLAVQLEREGGEGGYCKCPNSIASVGTLTPKNLNLSPADKDTMRTQINTDMACYSCGWAVLVLPMVTSGIVADPAPVLFNGMTAYNFVASNELIKEVDLTDTGLNGYRYLASDMENVYTTDKFLAIQLVSDGMNGCKCPVYNLSANHWSLNVSEIDFDESYGLAPVYNKVQRANPDFSISQNTMCRINLTYIP